MNYKVTQLHTAIRATFNKPQDTQFDEGKCVIWALAFQRWLAQHNVDSEIHVAYRDLADTAEPLLCEHATVFVPVLNTSFDRKGQNAQENWAGNHAQIPPLHWLPKSTAEIPALVETDAVFQRMVKNLKFSNHAAPEI